MKRLITLILAGLLIIGNTSSFAAEYKDKADALNAIGLFKGTEKGYELEKTFTRAEGAVMIVRLLGKESEAVKSNISVKFNDVQNHWAKPYTAYCFNNGITKGTSDTEFSPESKMSGQEYITLVLRAAGYPNVNPENVSLAAPEVSLVSSGELRELLKGEFTRDKMVLVSYRALGVKDLNGKALINKLIDEKVVNQNAAEKAGIDVGTANKYIEID